jgi:MFS transporter, ACS family, hexuronate transporter
MNKRVYPWVLVGLLSFNFGVVYFDRQALNFLMPLIQPELHLSNQQVGMLGSALGFSWALAGLVVGRVSDMLGRRKVILVIAAFIFSAASALSGWATSFSMLLVTRLLMGLAEGGVMPISQALISAEVDPARRGLAMGVAQNFGANLLSNFLGPIAVVAVGTAFGWRNAFYLAGLPGVLAAFLMLWLIREPPREQLAASAAAGGAVGGAGTARVGAGGSVGAGGAVEGGVGAAGVGAGGTVGVGVGRSGALSSPGAAWRHRNVLLCVAMSILLVAFVVVFSIFMPLYLVNVRGLSPKVMGWLMSMFGLTAMFFAFFVPGSSDVVGRRPVIISMSLIASLLPLSVLLIHQQLWLVFVLFGIGAAASGVFPLVMATIPSETVPPHQLATVLGLTMGLGEIIGGVFAPTLAGSAADAYGLGATLWIMVGLSVATACLACFVLETAPRVLRQRLPAFANT